MVTGGPGIIYFKTYRDVCIICVSDVLVLISSYIVLAIGERADSLAVHFHVELGICNVVATFIVACERQYLLIALLCKWNRSNLVHYQIVENESSILFFDDKLKHQVRTIVSGRDRLPLPFGFIAAIFINVTKGEESIRTYVCTRRANWLF